MHHTKNNTSYVTTHISGCRLASVLGDITRERVDAIVNAANTRLRHGGGVAGAILRKGGDTIQEESDAIAPVPTGKAASTGAGGLPCKRVIHAVGPVWGGGQADEERLLASAIRCSLSIAEEEMCNSLSLPTVSAGIFGFPAERAVAIILDEVYAHLAATGESNLSEIRFCNIEESMVELFDRELNARAGDKA